VSCSAGFALSVAVRMQEQDEETALSMRLWGKMRCWAMGWAAAGHGDAQCLGDASSCRARRHGWRRAMARSIPVPV